MSGIDPNLIAGPSRGSVTQRLPEMSVNIGLSADDSESIRVKASNQTPDEPKELLVRRVLPDDICDKLLLTAYGFDIQWDEWPEWAGSTPNSQYYPGICNQNIAETTRIHNQTLRLKPGQKFTAKIDAPGNDWYKTSKAHNQEKEMLESLSHRNIVQLYLAINLGDGQQHPLGFMFYPRMLFIIEHADFGNLLEYSLCNDQHMGRTMDTVMRDICLGLHYLHNQSIRFMELSDTMIGIYTDTVSSRGVGLVAKFRDLSYCAKVDDITKWETRDCYNISQLIDPLIQRLDDIYGRKCAVDTKQWRSIRDEFRTKPVTMDSMVQYINEHPTIKPIQPPKPGPNTETTKPNKTTQPDVTPPQPTDPNISSVGPIATKTDHEIWQLEHDEELRQSYPNLTPSTIGVLTIKDVKQWHTFSRNEKIEEVVSAYGIKLFNDRKCRGSRPNIRFMFGRLQENIRYANTDSLTYIEPRSSRDDQPVVMAKYIETESNQQIIYSQEFENQVFKRTNHRNVASIYLTINIGEVVPQKTNRRQLYIPSKFMGYRTVILIMDWPDWGISGFLSTYFTRYDVSYGSTWNIVMKDVFMGLQYLHGIGVTVGEVNRNMIAVYHNKTGLPKLVAKWVELGLGQYMGCNGNVEMDIKALGKFTIDMSLSLDQVYKGLPHIRDYYNFWQQIGSRLSTSNMTLNEAIDEIVYRFPDTTIQPPPPTPGPRKRTTKTTKTNKTTKPVVRPPPPTHPNIRPVIPIIPDEDSDEEIRQWFPNSTPNTRGLLTIRDINPELDSEDIQDVVSAYGFNLHDNYYRGRSYGSRPNTVFMHGSYGQNIRYSNTGALTAKVFLAKWSETGGDPELMYAQEFEKQVLKRTKNHRNIVSIHMTINIGKVMVQLPYQLYIPSSFIGYQAVILIMDWPCLGFLTTYFNRDDGSYGSTWHTIMKDVFIGLQYVHSIGVTVGQVNRNMIAVYDETDANTGRPKPVAKWVELGLGLFIDCDDIVEVDVIELGKFTLDMSLSLDKVYQGQFPNIRDNYFFWQQTGSALSSSNMTLDQAIDEIFQRFPDPTIRPPVRTKVRPKVKPKVVTKRKTKPKKIQL